MPESKGMDAQQKASLVAASVKAAGGSDEDAVVAASVVAAKASKKAGASKADALEVAKLAAKKAGAKAPGTTVAAGTSGAKPQATGGETRKRMQKPMPKPCASWGDVVACGFAGERAALWTGVPTQLIALSRLPVAWQIAL